MQPGNWWGFSTTGIGRSTRCCSWSIWPSSLRFEGRDSDTRRCNCSGKTALASSWKLEPVADAATARRLAFYESAGFVPLPFEHEQLPYHIGDSPIPLTLLSWQADGTPASAELVNQLEHLLRTCVMRLPHTDQHPLSE